MAILLRKCNQHECAGVVPLFMQDRWRATNPAPRRPQSAAQIDEWHRGPTATRRRPVITVRAAFLSAGQGRRNLCKSTGGLKKTAVRKERAQRQRAARPLTAAKRGSWPFVSGAHLTAD